MHILLFNLYKVPNPAYQNMAAGLRKRGHTLWLGVWNKQGELQWHDGTQVVATLSGPRAVSAGLKRVPIIRPLTKRLAFLTFIGRLRRFLRQVKPDIVHVDGGTFFYPWLLPIWMPSHTQFVFDVRHINVGLNTSLIGRFKEWQVIKVRELCGKVFYDHICFAHEQKTAPVRFIYVGGITKFRELEQLIFAAQKMAATTTSFQIDLVGPDKADGYYQQFIKKLELGHVITIKPPVPYQEVPKLMATNYDVGLAYTPDRKTWDYQPTFKVLEYRALGLPILSIDVASHHEVVKDGMNGLLVKHSVDTIAAGMLRFVQDRDFLNHARTQAHQMRQGLTVSEVVQQYDQNVYQKLKPEATNK